MSTAVMKYVKITLIGQGNCRFYLAEANCSISILKIHSVGERYTIQFLKDESNLVLVNQQFEK